MGAPSLPLVGPAAAAGALDGLGLPPLRPPLRALHLPGRAGARLPGHAPGQPARRLWPQRFPGYAGLSVRTGLAAREQLSRATPERSFLLRPLPACLPAVR